MKIVKVLQAAYLRLLMKAVLRLETRMIERRPHLTSFLVEVRMLGLVLRRVFRECSSRRPPQLLPLSEYRP